MKNILTTLVLLTAYVIPSYPVVPHSWSLIGSLVIANPVPEYAHEMVGWAEWMWLPPHRRRHPRRHLLPRKVRRRIQLRLRCLRKRQRRAALNRQHERIEQKRSRGRKMLLALAGAVLVLLLLRVTASAWLDAARQPHFWGVPYCLATHFVVGSGQKVVVCTERQHYRSEFDHCLICGEKLRSRRYLNWRKPIQMMSGTSTSPVGGSIVLVTPS